MEELQVAIGSQLHNSTRHLPGETSERALRLLPPRAGTSALGAVSWMQRQADRERRPLTGGPVDRNGATMGAYECLDVLAPAAVGVVVEHDVTDRHAGPLVGLPSPTTQHRLDAQDELFQAKRLGQVVAAPPVKPSRRSAGSSRAVRKITGTSSPTSPSLQQREKPSRPGRLTSSMRTCHVSLRARASPSVSVAAVSTMNPVKRSAVVTRSRIGPRPPQQECAPLGYRVGASVHRPASRVDVQSVASRHGAAGMHAETASRLVPGSAPAAETTELRT